MSMWWCCCDQGTTTLDNTNYANNWYDIDQLVDCTLVGADNADLASPWGIYDCNGITRFTNVAIANSTTISSATLLNATMPGSNIARIAPDGSLSAPTSGEYFRARVYGHDHDDSPAYSNATEAVGRTRTTAFVDIEYEYTGLVTITFIYSIDVTAQVQEIINRAGWSSGNDLSILYDENGSDRNDSGDGSRWGITADIAPSLLRIVY